MKNHKLQTLASLNISVVLLTAFAVGLLVLSQASHSFFWFCASWFTAAGFLIVAIIRSGKVIVCADRVAGYKRVAGISFGAIMLVATTLFGIAVCGFLILIFSDFES